MEIDEVIKFSVDAFREIKNESVRTHGSDPAAQVGVFRDGQMIATVVQPKGDSSIIAEMAHNAIVAFRADAICLMADTYRLTVEGPNAEVPEWANRRGALADRWSRGQHAGITEALMIVAMTDTVQRTVCLPYVRKGRKITWTTPDEDMGMQVEGSIPDALASAFAARPAFAVESAALAAMYGFDDLDYGVTIDAIAIVKLDRIGCAVAWMGEGAGLMKHVIERVLNATEKMKEED